MEDFCDRLKWSGYPCKVATKIVRNGLVNYLCKKNKAERSRTMFHRPEEEGRLQRRKMKITGRTNWFRPRRKTVDLGKNTNPRGKTTERQDKDNVRKETGKMTVRKSGDVRVTAPLFVQATENSSLACLLREEEKLGYILGWR